MEMNSQIKKNKVKKPALGRGLGSLLGESGDMDSSSRPQEVDGNLERTSEADLNFKSDKVYHVAVDKVVANKNQPRRTFEPGALQGLINSIKEKGIIQPLIVRRLSQDQFEIIAGERRWRAAQGAGLHEVPVILNGADDQNTMELALIENIQREDLNPIEEAEAYRFLMDEYQLTQQELARRVGRERVSIANTVRLLNLIPSVRKMVIDSSILKGQAKILVAISDEKLQLELAQKVAAEKMSVRALEKWVARLSRLNTKQQKTESLSHLDSQKRLQDLSEELQKLLGTKVNIHYHKGKGQLSIHYYSDDELNQLTDRLREVWKS